MKVLSRVIFFSSLLFLCSPTGSTSSEVYSLPVRTEPSLRELFHGHFDVGIGTGVTDSVRSALILHHASVISCENDLKAYSLCPGFDQWSWAGADSWLAWVESLGLSPFGHTLVWCHQMPNWLYELIATGRLTRDQALAWQDRHIRSVLSRYAKRIPAWDVVNEALSDASDSSEKSTLLRRDPWSDLCGEDYIVEAFRTARRVAPEVKLLYNDYGLENPAKRARLFRLLKILETSGCRPDAIGIQGHYLLDDPPVREIEETIRQIYAAGYPVHITELDVSVHHRIGAPDLQVLNASSKNEPSAHAQLSPGLAARQAARYREIFEVFIRNSDKIERVGFWNTDDGRSWLNNFPVAGRPDYPLLFDHLLRPKPAFDAVRQVAEEQVPRSSVSPKGDVWKR